MWKNYNITNINNANNNFFNLIFELMKTNFFKKAAYLVLAAGIALTSCSDDDLNGVNGGEEENSGSFDESQYEKGYLSMSFLNTVNSGLRTLGAGDTEVGRADESKVKRALVVLYVPDGSSSYKVAYQFDLTETINTPTHTMQARQVAKTDYKVAVFLNYTSAIKSATEVGDLLSDINAVVTLTGVTDFTGAGYDEFLMSNFAGLVDVPTAYIKDTKPAAEAAPVHVYVERAVAKVIFALKDGFGTANAHVSAMSWQIDVTNKSSYWMRKQTKMLSDLDPATTAIIDEPANLSPIDRDRTYAEDPNFETTSWASWNYRTSVEGATGLTEPTRPLSNFYNYTAIGNITRTAKEISSVDLDAVADWVYVPENTMVAEEQWEDVTTSILFKATIIPAKTVLDVTLGTASYYVYNNKVFSAVELESINDGTFLYNDGTNDFTWAQYVAVNSDLKDLQALLQKKATRDAILGNGNTDYSSVPTASVKYEGLTFFKDGVNYYNIPIRHFSDLLQSTKMAYGRYGVVRNNVYKITLNSINNFGDIVIPDKGNPDDKYDWLSVRFEILPWVIRTQSVDL